MAQILIKNFLTKNVILWLVLHLLHHHECSEFPDRECCDPVFPFDITDPEPLPPALPTTTISSSSAAAAAGHQTIVGNNVLQHTGGQALPGRSGPNVKIAIAILNCILARQLCFEDPSCSAILEIIPRVCGPVPVACSTVTVTKCQAALRTLQAFPFFRPTCLCKEPGVDPDCNYFRDFLFDHPCGFVLKKVEKDPYPVDALPTCNHALSVCQQERKCIKLFEDFKLHCKVRENKCRMEDKEACHEAWTNLRLSPMFGCICPNNHMKRRCDKIFNVVNHNPCVDDLLPKALDIASGTSTNSVNSNYFPTSDYIGEIRPASRYPYTFPYFLYPSSRKIPIALASHRPDIEAHHSNRTWHYPKLHRTNYSTNNNNNNNNNYDDLDENENVKHFNQRILHTFQHSDNFSSVSHKPMANLTNGLMHLQRQMQKQIYDVVRAMGLDDNYHHRILDDNAAMIETPLVGPLNAHIRQHFKTALYPYNVTSATAGATYSIEDDGANGNGISSFEKNSDDIETDESHPIHFQSTCHIALDACREESSCSTSLQTVIHHCDIDRCNKPACMESLQSFYRDNSHEDMSLDAALCLCRKTSSRHDSCMLAKEKLHPICAQRPPNDGTSTVATTNGAFNPLPACHTLADLCKEDPDCRSRLEFFEQSCAVDSVTKKCAGKMGNCRLALLGVMGTPLRSLCACHGSDLQQLYECLGWQRLLWLNPCVVEAQKDFHLKRLAELGLLITTTTTTTTQRPTTTTTTSTTTSTTTTTTTPAPIRITFRERLQTPVPQTPPPEIHYHRPVSHEDFGNYIDGEEVVDENFLDDNKNDDFYGITTEMLGMEVATMAPATTTVEVSTVPTRYCVVQRPHTPEQLIPEGQSRRLYIMDDAECSELCSCSAESVALSCHALCVPLVPCRTSLAFYSHTSPAYQAFRGRCLCYSGRFICMRPPPGDYKLPGGVFLLLGYSSTDEALLRPHTNLGVQDAVRSLQQYILQHISNHTLCTLSLFNITDENIILSVRLPYDTKLTTLDMLKKEKQYCTSILETVSHQINTEYEELTAHRLLSIFKMAEVQVIWPDMNGAASAKHVNLQLLLVAILTCWYLSHQIASTTSVLLSRT